MKVIIPMAGMGSRLRPISHTTAKPLIPLLGKTVIERILDSVTETLNTQIDEIVFVVSPDFQQSSKQRLKRITNTRKIKINFCIQEEALGTAHAVYAASSYLEGPILVLFADTLFYGKDKLNIKACEQAIWVCKVKDPRRFGVVVVKDDKIVGFIEKPQKPISNFALIGCYYFSKGEVLKTYIEKLIKHNITGVGGEYYLTDVYDMMLKDGHVFSPYQINEWLDCGTLEAWLDTNQKLLDKYHLSLPKYVFEGVQIIPPVYIGDNVKIKKGIIGPYVSVESDTILENIKLKNVIIGSNGVLENVILNDSILGNHIKITNHKGMVFLGDHSCIIS